MEVLAEDEDGRYAATALGEELRSDRSGPQVRLFASETEFQAWLHLDHSIRTGERAFDFVYGMRNWDYYATHPAEAAIFDAGMSAITRPASQAVAGAYDFSRFASLADIGGGEGTLLLEIMRRHPFIRGLLFDRPEVIERARKHLTESGLADRCDLVAGSFFDSVPSGAGAYIMKSIIHDWADGEAVAILQRCRDAVANTGAPLLLVERVLRARVGPEDLMDLLSDINMMVNPGGLERTEAEFGALMLQANFRLERLVPTGTQFQIIEAVPA